jgi:cell division protein FtsW
MTRFWAGTVFPMGIFGVVALLIFREPDYGTTLLVAAVCSIVLLLAGVRWIHLFPPIVAGFSLIVYAIATNQNRMNRILAWVFPDKFQDGTGYQAHEAKLALGMGGWQGVGLGNGVQKLGRVPENETDFIFSILGEELGLIATLSVILLFMLLVFCGIYIAAKSNNDFGFLLASGITFMIGLQAFINIGVVTSFLPNKGIALPFISYGGSNLTMMLVAIGILISVGLHVDNVESNPMNSFDSMESSSKRIL